MPRVGGLGGAKPPRQAVCGPNFNTPYEISRPFKPLGPALYHLAHMPIREYLDELADNILVEIRKAVPRGKRRRNWIKTTSRARQCGTELIGIQCGCGYVKGGIVADCGLRTCPYCARRRSKNLAKALDELLCRLPSGRGLGFYLLTFTVRYDPMSASDLSVDGILERSVRARRGVSHCWRRYLKMLGTDKQQSGIAWFVEVSPRGAVHIHALFFGGRPDVEKLRMLYLERVPSSPFVNVKYVRTGQRSRRKALREVCKYLVKAASPVRRNILEGGVGEFLDPRLAARVEVALFAQRLFERRGCFRGLGDDDADDLIDGCKCPRCGAADQWSNIRMQVADFLSVAPCDWRPFVRGRPHPEGGHHRSD